MSNDSDTSTSDGETKWFVVTFAALIEAVDEYAAKREARNCAEAIEEHIGSHAGSDPWLYRTKVAGVEPFVGELPWDEEERLLNEKRQAGATAGASWNPACSHGVPYREPGKDNGCKDCAAQARASAADARAWLDGLRKGTTR